MGEEIITIIQNHRLWIDSLGKDGEKAYFENVLFEKMKEINLDLSQGSFVDCTFRKVFINCWDFYATKLFSIVFDDSLIESSVFVKADLFYAEFSNTKINMTNFSKADLSNVTFRNLKIENSKFINALLDNITFKDVHIKNVDFTGALIENMLFDRKTTIRDIVGIDNAQVKSINIGTLDRPIYLKNEEALRWIKNKAGLK